MLLYEKKYNDASGQSARDNMLVQLIQLYK